MCNWADIHEWWLCSFAFLSFDISCLPLLSCRHKRLPVHYSLANRQHNDVMAWKRFPNSWPLLRESPVDRRIPFTKGQCCRTWVFPLYWYERTVKQIIELPVISDAIVLIWHHGNFSQFGGLFPIWSGLKIVRSSYMNNIIRFLMI